MMPTKKRDQLIAKINDLKAELEEAMAAEVAWQRQAVVDGGSADAVAPPPGTMRQLITRGDHCLCRVLGALLEQKAVSSSRQASRDAPPREATTPQPRRAKTPVGA
jgi:hypothetical protein